MPSFLPLPRHVLSSHEVSNQYVMESSVNALPPLEMRREAVSAAVDGNAVTVETDQSPHTYTNPLCNPRRLEINYIL